MIQPAATQMPPKAITSLGPSFPRLSTIQPWIGVSHVSNAIKIANANWIEAIDQPCALLIGLTKNVQPYCRLAIKIMQAIQTISCVQRVAGLATARVSAVVDAAVMGRPPFLPLVADVSCLGCGDFSVLSHFLRVLHIPRGYWSQLLRCSAAPPEPFSGAILKNLVNFRSGVCAAALRMRRHGPNSPVMRFARGEEHSMTARLRLPGLILLVSLPGITSVAAQSFGPDE